MRRPRILLADDHGLVAEAFARLLEPDCQVVGTVTDGRTLLEAAPELKPDVIILDLAMPLLNGLDAGRRLKRTMPEVGLIVLTVNEDPEVVAEAFRAGASGYLLKSSAAAELFTAIREVLQGRSYVTPRVVTRGVLDGSSFLGGDGDAAVAPAAGPSAASAKLTPRQREVLQLLAEGHSMKQAAAILRVTPRTVAFHKYRLMDELRLKTNADLIQFAIKSGIVSV